MTSQGGGIFYGTTSSNLNNFEPTTRFNHIESATVHAQPSCELGRIAAVDFVIILLP